MPKRDRADAPQAAPGAPTIVPARRGIVATLVAGLALLAVGVAAALAQRGEHAAATNRATTGGVLMTKPADARFCQADERIPAGANAVRVSLGSLSPTAPRIALTLRDDSGGVYARGASGARWSRHAVVVPLREGVAQEVVGRVCVQLASTAPHQRVRFYGQQPDLSAEAEAEAGAGAVQSGRVRVEYLYPHKTSWWAFGGTVADRLGRGHAWSGRSVGLAAVLLSLISIALASWQLVRRDADA